MSRTARVVSESGIYHILIRSGKEVFSNYENIDEFVYILKSRLQNSDSEYIAFAAGKDHAHIALRNTSGNVGLTLKPVFTSFARYYNRISSTSGKLFEDRFKSEPVKESELMRLLYFFRKYHDFTEYDGDIPSYDAGDIKLFGDFYRRLSPEEIASRISDFSGVSSEELTLHPRRYADIFASQKAIPTAVINTAFGIKTAAAHPKAAAKSKAAPKPETPSPSPAGSADKPKKKDLNVWLL